MTRRGVAGGQRRGGRTSGSPNTVVLLRYSLNFPLVVQTPRSVSVTVCSPSFGAEQEDGRMAEQRWVEEVVRR